MRDVTDRVKARPLLVHCHAHRCVVCAVYVCCDLCAVLLCAVFLAPASVMLIVVSSAMMCPTVVTVTVLGLYCVGVLIGVSSAMA